MNGYGIAKQAEGLWRLDDGKGGAMYLVEGEERAALIDTGISDQPLAPVLKTLTDRPVDLALTHAHIDHMYRSGEFDRIYLHERDIADWGRGLGLAMSLARPIFQCRRQTYRVDTFLPLGDDSTIPLGGFSLRCLRLSGHTAGSVLFIDDRHKAVFCGDALGSGSGVWMFLPFCMDIRTYHVELAQAERLLAPVGGYTFYGGHTGQDEGEGASPLCYGTIGDMRLLCEKLLSGELEPTGVNRIPVLRLLYARYGRAAVVTRRGKLK